MTVKCVCYDAADISTCIMSMPVYTAYSASAWGLLACQLVLLYVHDSWHWWVESLTAWAITDANTHTSLTMANVVTDCDLEAKLIIFQQFFSSPKAESSSYSNEHSHKIDANQSHGLQLIATGETGGKVPWWRAPWGKKLKRTECYPCFIVPRMSHLLRPKKQLVRSQVKQTTGWCYHWVTAVCHDDVRQIWCLPWLPS